MVEEVQDTGGKLAGSVSQQAMESVKETGRKLGSGSRKKWIGIGVIVVVLILAVWFWPGTGSSPGNLVVGAVADENAIAIDGAVVSNGVVAVATDLSGVFEIEAGTDEVLTISAHGFEPTVMSGAEASSTITLTSTVPGIVHLTVLGSDRRSLDRALVVLLEPNTSTPIAQAVTDEIGAVTFANVPSGQTAMVVLHSEYDPGWVETSLEADGLARPVIQMTKTAGERTSELSEAPFRLIAPAHAQEERFHSDLVDEDPPWQEIRVTIESLEHDRVLITQNTRTVIATNLAGEALGRYVDQYIADEYGSSQVEVPNRLTWSANYALTGEMGGPAALTTYRLIDSSSAEEGILITSHMGQRGVASEKLEQQVQLKTNEQWIVEMKLPVHESAEPMMFMSRQQGVNPIDVDSEPITVTSWSAAEALANRGYSNIEFNQPLTSVCCRRPDGDTQVVAGDADAFPDQASSNSVGQSGLEASGENGSLLFDPVEPPQLLLTEARDRLKTENPGLTGIDEVTGADFSLLDIPVPHPEHAPSDFRNNYLTRGGYDMGVNTYLTDPASYKAAWQDYLYETQAFLGDQSTLAETRDWMLSQLSSNKAMFPDPYMIDEFELPSGFDNPTGAGYQTILNDPLRGATPSTSDSGSAGTGFNLPPPTLPDPDDGEGNASSTTGDSGDASAGPGVGTTINAPHNYNQPSCGGGTCSR